MSQYGIVKKITFSPSSGGEADVCRVVMANSRAASLLHQNVFNLELFGEFIQAALSKIGDEDFNPLEIELEDGSRSWKEFGEREESCTWPEVSSAPSKV